MKKVLIYRSSYLPISETFISDHIKSLKQYTPIVLCEYEMAANHKADIKPYKLYKTKIGKKVYEYVGYSYAFNKVLKREQPNIIHAHFLTDAAKILPLVEKLDIPFVVTAHGYDASIYDEYMAKTPDGQLLLTRRDRLIKRVDKVFCVSDFIKHELILRGFPEDKLVTSHLGVSFDRFNSYQTGKKQGIITVGRLVEKKGTRYLIEAYSKLPTNLRSEHPLIIVGDGPLKNELVALAKKLNIDVSFLGACSQTKVYELISKSKLFIFPSVRSITGDAEGMGIAIMEALALKTPAIVFEGQPMADLFKQNNYLGVSRCFDTDDLSKGIAKILQDIDLYKDMVGMGSAFVRKLFNLEKNTEELEMMYQQIIINKRKL